MFAFLKLGAGLGEGNVGKQNLPPQNVSLGMRIILFSRNKRLRKNF